MGLFGGLFGGGPKNAIGNNPDGLEANFDKVVGHPKGPAFGDRLRDAFSILAGPGNPYQQHQEAQAQAEMRQREEQAKRQAAWEDWQRQQQWQRDNPKPPEPTPEERLVEWANSLPPDQREQALQTLDQFRPKMIGDPLSGYQFAPRPSGPTGGIAEGATATNPQTGAKIQYRNGQWVPMGGGASNGTGGFPQ